MNAKNGYEGAVAEVAEVAAVIVIVLILYNCGGDFTVGITQVDNFNIPAATMERREFLIFPI